MYKLTFLPMAAYDILEIEAGLYEFSPTAADQLVDAIKNLTETLTQHPLMYQEYEEDNFYRSMPLPYDYRLFYHVEKSTKSIRIHRILRGMMDLETHL